jgi:hypothetical protein
MPSVFIPSNTGKWSSSATDLANILPQLVVMEKHLRVSTARTTAPVDFEVQSFGRNVSVKLPQTPSKKMKPRTPLKQTHATLSTFNTSTKAPLKEEHCHACLQSHPSFGVELFVAVLQGPGLAFQRNRYRVQIRIKAPVQIEKLFCGMEEEDKKKKKEEGKKGIAYL